MSGQPTKQLPIHCIKNVQDIIYRMSSKGYIRCFSFLLKDQLPPMQYFLACFPAPPSDTCTKSNKLRLVVLDDFFFAEDELMFNTLTAAAPAVLEYPEHPVGSKLWLNVSGEARNELLSVHRRLPEHCSQPVVQNTAMAKCSVFMVITKLRTKRTCLEQSLPYYNALQLATNSCYVHIFYVGPQSSVLEVPRPAPPAVNLPGNVSSPVRSQITETPKTSSRFRCDTNPVTQEGSSSSVAQLNCLNVVSDVEPAEPQNRCGTTRTDSNKPESLAGSGAGSVASTGIGSAVGVAGPSGHAPASPRKRVQRAWKWNITNVKQLQGPCVTDIVGVVDAIVWVPAFMQKNKNGRRTVISVVDASCVDPKDSFLLTIFQNHTRSVLSRPLSVGDIVLARNAECKTYKESLRGAVRFENKNYSEAVIIESTCTDASRQNPRPHPDTVELQDRLQDLREWWQENKGEFLAYYEMDAVMHLSMPAVPFPYPPYQPVPDKTLSECHKSILCNIYCEVLRVSEITSCALVSFSIRDGTALPVKASLPCIAEVTNTVIDAKGPDSSYDDIKQIIEENIYKSYNIGNVQVLLGPKQFSIARLIATGNFVLLRRVKVTQDPQDGTVSFSMLNDNHSGVVLLNDDHREREMICKRLLKGVPQENVLGQPGSAAQVVPGGNSTGVGNEPVDAQPAGVLSRVSGQPAGASGQPTGESGQPAGAPGQPAGAPGQPAGASGQPAGASGQPAGAPGQPAGAPGQPAGASGQPAGAPDQPAGAPDQPAGAPDQPAGAPDQPTGASGQPAGAPGQPAEAPGQPAGASGQPTGASGQPTGASGQPAGTSETTSSQPAGTSETTSGQPAGTSDTTSGHPAGTSETTSGQPAGTSETTSGQPAGTSETSSQPAGTSETSGQPAGTSETTSGQPAVSSETSSQPAGTSETSGQPAGTSETSGQPAGTSETSGQPAGTSNTSDLSAGAPGQSAGSSEETSRQPVGTSVEASVQLPTISGQPAGASDVASETGSKVASEVVSETASKTAVEVVSETGSEVVSETASEVVSETASEVVSETASEVVSETASKTAVEVGSEVVSETASEVVSETASEVASGAPSVASDELRVEVLSHPTSDVGTSTTEGPILAFAEGSTCGTTHPDCCQSSTQIHEPLQSIEGSVLKLLKKCTVNLEKSAVGSEERVLLTSPRSDKQSNSTNVSRVGDKMLSPNANIPQININVPHVKSNKGILIDENNQSTSTSSSKSRSFGTDESATRGANVMLNEGKLIGVNNQTTSASPSTVPSRGPDESSNAENMSNALQVDINSNKSCSAPPPDPLQGGQCQNDFPGEKQLHGFIATSEKEPLNLDASSDDCHQLSLVPGEQKVSSACRRLPHKRRSSSGNSYIEDESLPTVSASKKPRLGTKFCAKEVSAKRVSESQTSNACQNIRNPLPEREIQSVTYNPPGDELSNGSSKNESSTTCGRNVSGVSDERSVGQGKPDDDPVLYDAIELALSEFDSIDTQGHDVENVSSLPDEESRSSGGAAKEGREKEGNCVIKASSEHSSSKALNLAQKYNLRKRQLNDQCRNSSTRTHPSHSRDSGTGGSSENLKLERCDLEPSCNLDKKYEMKRVGTIKNLRTDESQKCSKNVTADEDSVEDTYRGQDSVNFVGKGLTQPPHAKQNNNSPQSKGDCSKHNKSYSCKLSSNSESQKRSRNDIQDDPSESQANRCPSSHASMIFLNSVEMESMKKRRIGCDKQIILGALLDASNFPEVDSRVRTRRAATSSSQSKASCSTALNILPELTPQTGASRHSAEVLLLDIVVGPSRTALKLQQRLRDGLPTNSVACKNSDAGASTSHCGELSNFKVEPLSPDGKCDVNSGRHLRGRGDDADIQGTSGASSYYSTRSAVGKNRASAKDASIIEGASQSRRSKLPEKQVSSLGSESASTYFTPPENFDSGYHVKFGARQKREGCSLNTESTSFVTPLGGAPCSNNRKMKSHAPSVRSSDSDSSEGCSDCCTYDGSSESSSEESSSVRHESSFHAKQKRSGKKIRIRPSSSESKRNSRSERSNSTRANQMDNQPYGLRKRCKNVRDVNKNEKAANTKMPRHSKKKVYCWQALGLSEDGPCDDAGYDFEVDLEVQVGSEYAECSEMEISS